MKLHGPFFGDRISKTVHDLNKAKPKCKINEVLPINKKYFNPDTLEQAIEEGYQQCRCTI